MNKKNKFGIILATIGITTALGSSFFSDKATVIMFMIIGILLLLCGMALTNDKPETTGEDKK